jgi:putative endopeptidase
MTKTILVAGISALAMALSSPVLAQDSAPGSQAAQAEPVEPPPMTWPAMGFDPNDLDPAVTPGDDFDAYVNGKWEKATPIPPQYSTYGVVKDLRLKAENEVQDIISDMVAENAPKDTIAQKIGDSYKAFDNVKAIDAKGMAAAQPYLDRIFAIGSYADLAKLFAEPGMPDPFAIDVHADIENPDANILNLWTAGYSLPDRDNYLVDSAKNREMQAKYKDYLAFMLGKAGYQDPKAAAESVYQLEYDLAALDFDRTLKRNPELLQNVVPRSELDKMAGDFPLQAYLDDRGVGSTDTLIIDQMPPDAAKIAKLGLTPGDLKKLGAGMPGMLKLITQVPLATWKAWAAAQFMESYAPFLPSEIDQRNFAFWGTYMDGTEIQRPRDKRAVSVVRSQLGEAIGKVYVQRYFPPSSKAAMQKLVANLLTAMGEEIDANSWMSDATKKAAHAKLAAFTVKIGYADKFKTYDGMEISADDPIGNAFASRKWEWGYTRDKLGKPVDRSEWYMTPQTVNAYYSSTTNSINFPAAYLQPPNYSPTADPAVNYGAIGSTIGHEISHGFDDQGSKFDGTGKFHDWWTKQDRTKFDAQTKSLAEQYDKFCPLDDGKTCINGKLTLGEDIADLAGLTIAYRAYRMSLNGKEAPVIDGLTGDQRFFIAYAIGNRGKWTDAFTRQILQTDPHPPDKARTNIVLQNFDAWYKAFDVKPGDKMYLPPDKRVRIW